MGWGRKAPLTKEAHEVRGPQIMLHNGIKYQNITPLLTGHTHFQKNGTTSIQLRYLYILSKATLYRASMQMRTSRISLHPKLLSHSHLWPETKNLHKWASIWTHSKIHKKTQILLRISLSEKNPSIQCSRVRKKWSKTLAPHYLQS